MVTKTNFHEAVAQFGENGGVLLEKDGKFACIDRKTWQAEFSAEHGRKPSCKEEMEEVFRALDIGNKEKELSEHKQKNFSG